MAFLRKCDQLLLQERAAILVKLQVFHGSLKIMLRRRKSQTMPIYYHQVAYNSCKILSDLSMLQLFTFGSSYPPSHTYQVITSNKLSYSFNNQPKKPSHLKNCAGIYFYHHHSSTSLPLFISQFVLIIFDPWAYFCSVAEVL